MSNDRQPRSVFPLSRKTWIPPRQSPPRGQRKHVEPGCSVRGPGKWTSFGASSLDQLGLFCFLNTHRCSGSILYFFYFFIFFSPTRPPLSLSLTSSTIRVRPPYSSHRIYHSIFFFFSFSLPLSLPMSRAAIIDRSAVSQVVILTAALKHTYYYYITRPCAYMFSLYIYIHVYILLLLLSFAYIYI